MKKPLIVAATVVGALGACCCLAGPFRLQADKDNVVGSRLEGRWQPERAITLRLTGREATPGDVRQQIVFDVDPTVVDRIPDKYAAFLGEKPIYLAGLLTLRGEKHPFILIAHKGNPLILYFREQNGDPFGDAESFNVMLAVAKDRGKDLLFVGGDFNNQPFMAYERVHAQ